ncbi:MULTISPECIES: Xaa-Pro dipeptidase [Rhodanobacter]|uniref:Xaa-Pro dipeptidase n=1 Tax=Rhodanobacter TaxID=75309 RepID=UPI000260C808|nr:MULTISPECIES: Xaa-Pro dipeptidase [Rhodanobacter]EIM03633.1 proline dipeptidase [Rhodanobacter denitrificans]KZC20771.1 Xaa-Pro dipeptidase [Rhodanobacter denitrificans]UJJ50525.1 Xaa-Pro dipeptidase [Rhodanobacter denitrificans]UJM91150.1 Xaa-Pro dipeptidase [Rhodanobacter denitrificans]UJM93241.1 Xaa-Pro dipeptidase [Rhodanobacter denitrificans]
MHQPSAPLYAQHLATLCERADRALAQGGFDHLLVAAGTPPRKFLDDQDYPFVANPHFRHWLPLDGAPGSWVAYTPGAKPKLVFVQPHDYWHVVPEAPHGYWVEHFDIVIVRSAADAVAQLPRGRGAVLAPACPGIDGVEINNPQAVLDCLHWHRSYKTPYELALMREANRIGTRAHRAAEAAFRAGRSEFGIHLTYLAAARQIDAELPYASIVALNQHGAVLHYTHFDRMPPAQGRSFLIDAGASAAGYASDITRTYAGTQAGEFQALIDSMDAAQQGFVAKVRAGQSYPELHLHAHHVIAGVLREHGFIRLSAESAVESGVTGTFFPHGLGHPLGLQVHDVAGFQQSERGGSIPRPDGHPYLRMTRVLEPGMVVTIEPGLYFIDMLLAELRDKPVAADIDWAKVDHFRQYGGIRIEDDVACTDGAPENLTRDAFASA